MGRHRIGTISLNTLHAYVYVADPHGWLSFFWIRAPVRPQIILIQTLKRTVFVFCDMIYSVVVFANHFFGPKVRSDPLRISYRAGYLLNSKLEPDKH